MIEKIRLRNFRRFDDQALDFKPGVNLIEGVNNAGKSTILYAIEYALFGHVRGFKTKSSYTRHGEKDAGVELVIKGRDGNRYRMLRFHKLSKAGKKVSSSHFTLKRYISSKVGEGEEYVLSSDFGDTEEQLALKIREITGISRRLFEVTVSARQGGLPDILRGSNSLDIVLGATAAEALSQAFKDRKRVLEKDLSQMPILEALLEKIGQEKEYLGNEIQKVTEDKKKVSEEQKELKASFEEAEVTVGTLSKLEKVKSDWEKAGKDILVTKTSLEDIKTQLEAKDFKGDISPWTKALEVAKEGLSISQSNLSEARSKAGKVAKLVADNQEKQGNLEGQLQSFSRRLSLEMDMLLDQAKKAEPLENLEKEMESVRAEIREYESELQTLRHKRGDLEGRLSRRKSVKGEQSCEYCGAELDPAKVEKELKELEALLSDLDIKDKTVKDAISKQKKTVEKIENKKLLSEAKSTAIQVNKTREELEKAQKENKKTQSDLEELIRKESEARANVDEKQRTLGEIQDLANRETKLEREHSQALAKVEGSKKELGRLIDELVNLAKSKSKSDLMNAIAVKLKSITKKDYEEFPPEIREIEQLTREKHTEFRVKLEQISTRMYELSKREGELNDRTMTLDADIGETTSKLDRLVEMRKHTERYTELADGFKAVQESIRENAAHNLSESSLNFHKQMFPDTEVERLKIRPEDYAMEIAPAGWDENVPVTVYQGGGMQLLLGLSYRLAIGDFLDGVPFLFADEPTYGADSENRKRVLTSFKNITISNQTLLVTHQSDALEFQPANEITVYREGVLSKATIKKRAEKAAKKPPTSKPKKAAKAAPAKTKAKKATPKKATGKTKPKRTRKQVKEGSP